jgi:hypothetical protein
MLCVVSVFTHLLVGRQWKNTFVWGIWVCLRHFIVKTSDRMNHGTLLGNHSSSPTTCSRYIQLFMFQVRGPWWWTDSLSREKSPGVLPWRPPGGMLWVVVGEWINKCNVACLSEFLELLLSYSQVQYRATFPIHTHSSDTHSLVQHIVTSPTHTLADDMASDSRGACLDSQQHWFKWTQLNTHSHYLATDENTETSTPRSEGWGVVLKGVRTTSEQHRATENHPVSGLGEEGFGEEGRSEQSKRFKNPLFA